MRILLSLLFAAFLSLTAVAQSISYDIPSGYENDLSKADYKLIVDTAVSIVAKRYAIESVKHGTIQLTKASGQGGFNLDNLMLKCIAEKDRSAWGAIIHSHFDQLFASFDEQKKIDFASYESVKKYLSLRIYPRSTVLALGGTANIVARIDLEDTYTLLMLDLPGAFSSVQPKMFDLWKKDTAEVFKAALANISKQKVDKESKTIPFDGVNVEIHFIGEENYAASYALDLQDNSPEFVGDWGCAVAIPNKGLVNICKISHDKPVDFIKFIQLAKPAIEKAYKEHPQAISPEFFWYYKGRFTHINVASDDKGNINVIAPMGLSELMTKKP